MKNKARTVAVIDVGDCRNAEAKHLAGRFADRRLGNDTLIHRIARRLSESTRVDQVLITGAHLPSSLLTAGLAGVEVLELPHAHILERLAAAADCYDAEWIVYVPGNRPFVDPALIDCLVNRAIQAAGDLDYVGFCGSGGSWERMRWLGVAGEICHADALRRLRRNVDRLDCDPDELSLAAWMYDAPGHYNLQFVSLPDALDRDDLRFAIEDESDWEYAQMFSDYVRDDVTEWQLLTNLVRDNETLRDTMAQRNSVR